MPGWPSRWAWLETRPVDLRPRTAPWATAAGASRHTTILAIKNRAGEDVVDPYTPPDGDPGGQPPGGLDRHRHPGRQHEPAGQPVLGRVRHRGTGRRPPAGDAQDRDEQRRQGPQRVRLHRPADRGGSGGWRLRARGGSVERQQRQHGLDSATGLLDRRLDLRLAGIRAGSQRRVARSRTSSAQPKA